jgi:hypothetical protein
VQSNGVVVVDGMISLQKMAKRTKQITKTTTPWFCVEYIDVTLFTYT